MRKLGKLQVWAQLPNPMTNSLIKMEHCEIVVKNVKFVGHYVGHHVGQHVGHHIGHHIGHLVYLHVSHHVHVNAF